MLQRGFPGGSVGKESACSAGDGSRWKFNPRAGKIPWRRVWQPTAVFLPGESHGQRSLVGYSPRVSKSRTLLKWLNTHTHTHTHSHATRMGFPGGSHGKEPDYNVGDHDLNPPARKIPWRRECFLTPVFLPGEFHVAVRHDWATNTHMLQGYIVYHGNYSQCFIITTNGV